MAERHPGYYAVIPADVRYDDNIPANAKLLYGEIAALISGEGFCYASNDYFAKVYQISERTVRALVKALQKAGYVEVELEKDAQTGQVIRRKIWLKVSSTDERPVAEIFPTPGRCFPGGEEDIFQPTLNTNLSITNIERKNIKKEKTTKKNSSPPAEDFDPLAAFTVWIAKTFPGRDRDEKNALYLAMSRFHENRVAIKKPMKSQGAVTALTNKLKKYAGQNIDTMIDLLDTATVNGWQSVYKPNDGAAPAQAAPPEGRQKEWL